LGCLGHVQEGIKAKYHNFTKGTAQMKLITETIEDVKVITEGKGVDKQHFIEGVFLQADLKNRNGRIYPFETLNKEVTRYNKEFVEKGRALGELGHPEGPTINLERVSHIIKELKVDRKNFIGKAKILETPYGKIVKNLIDEGVKLGVSSRGMGSIEQKAEASYVKNDFFLATAADIVADPSAPDAFVQGVMEGAEWIYESGVFKSVDLENYKNEIDTASRQNREDVMMKGFAKIMTKLA
jgi:hypothetical protein